MKHVSEWQTVRHGLPQGSIYLPLFFQLYINDLPKIISDICKPILSAGNTSIIVTNSDPLSLKAILKFYTKQP
jgi:hypothetical protein